MSKNFQYFISNPTFLKVYRKKNKKRTDLSNTLYDLFSLYKNDIYRFKYFNILLFACCVEEPWIIFISDQNLINFNYFHVTKNILNVILLPYQHSLNCLRAPINMNLKWRLVYHLYFIDTIFEIWKFNNKNW